MRIPMHAVYTIFAIAALPALGCTAATTSNEPATEQSQDALSVYQWSPDQKAGDNNSYESAGIATMAGGGVMMVHTGDDEGGDADMYWSYSASGLSWSDDVKIDKMETSSAPRLAGFNKQMYLVHTGVADKTSVWMSRLGANSTGFLTWGQDFILPYKSSTSPAIAAYAGSLYIIGSTPGTGQLWVATMSTSETFSAPTDIPKQFSYAAPGIASHLPAGARNESLYIAYLPNKSAGIVTSTLTIAKGSSGAWTAPAVVPNSMTKGANQQSLLQPALGSYNGVLHMIHTEPALSDLIMWTYLDGTSWSTEVSLGTERMYSFASLTPLKDRLVMVHTSSIGDHHSTFPDFNTAVYSEIFQ